MVLQGAQFGSGLMGAITQVAVLAAALVLVLMLVALGGFAYRSLRGGIEWPDDVDEEGESGDGVRQGEEDEEWKYY